MVEERGESAYRPQRAGRDEPESGIDERSLHDVFIRRKVFTPRTPDVLGESLIQPVSRPVQMHKREDAERRMPLCPFCQNAERIGTDPRILVQKEGSVIPFV